MVAFHEDLIEGHEDARGVHSLCAAYGVEPRPVREADKRECEVCGAIEMFVKAPNLLDADVAVMCGRCAHVLPPKAKLYAQYLEEIA